MHIGCGASIFPSWLRKGGGPAPSTLLNGLVSYWSLDELSGTRVDSIVASGNDLTDNNTVGYSLAGPSGTVASFVAANSESLTSTANALLTLGGAGNGASVAGWFRRPAYPASYPLLIGANNTGVGANDSICIFAGADTNVYGRFDTPNENHIQVGVYYWGNDTLNAWAFFVVTFDPTDRKGRLYKDGVLIGTTAATAADTALSTASSFGISGWNSGFQDQTAAFAGAWNRTLSGPDIVALFNSGNGKAYADLTAGEKVGLVSYWNLDEVSGQRNDSHGTNHLTDNNTVGSATAVAGAMHNTAASFVGADNEFLTLGAATDPNPKTYSLWVKTDGGAATSRICVDRGLFLDVYHDLAGNLKADAYYYDGATYPLATTGWVTLTYGWLHIVTDVADGATANIYVNDGQFSGQVAYPGTEGTLSNFELRNNNGTLLMDEVGRWSRVLTSDERTELYNSGAGKFYPFA